MKRSWSVMRGAVCVVLLLPLVLTACGHKGKLKTPSQVEAEEQKKARKEAKKAAEEAKKTEEKKQQVPADGQKE